MKAGKQLRRSKCYLP